MARTATGAAFTSPPSRSMVGGPGRGSEHACEATGIFVLAALGRNRFEPALPATRKSTHSSPAGGCSCLCHRTHLYGARTYILVGSA
jgi:hypothetical protein